MKFAPKLKLIKHPELNEYLQGEYVNPINVEISPSGVCQANCEWCFFKDEKNQNMVDTGLLMKAINQFKGMGVKAVTWTGGGEPTLHKDFHKFVRTLYSLNIKQGLFTNGLKVNYDPSLFEWIRVSKTNKGWNLCRLLELRKCKSLGMCINYTGDDKIIKGTYFLGRKIGIDYIQVRPALMPKGDKSHWKIPSYTGELMQYADYKFEDQHKDKCYNLCEGFHFVPYINEKAEVLACPYRTETDYYKLGNLNKNTFFEIMVNAPRYKQVNSKCQVCCKLHEVNELIHNLRKIEDGEFV